MVPLENMARQNDIDSLIDQGLLWRGNGAPLERVEPSGQPQLDRLLGGGWPRAALTELLGNGTLGLSLLAPLLARLSRGSRWLAWIAPPHTPYVPALTAAGVDPRRVLLVTPSRPGQHAWATEQALAAGTCSAVLAWPGPLEFPELRRLQLAAERGDCSGFLFRPAELARQASPAALRLLVEPDRVGWRLQVVKRRSGWGGERLLLAGMAAGSDERCVG